MINGRLSFWWEALGGRPTARPSLREPLECDVAVVGGGYTGLWTAWYLKRARPSWSIVVLEREVAGFGASGRNGGWLSGLLAGSRERWAHAHGAEAVVRAQREMFRTVDEVIDWCAAEGVECDQVKGGSLRVATSTPQLRRLQAELSDERAWGFGEEDICGLAPAALGERLRVQDALGALFTPHCARIDPAKLLRGLAAAVEKSGVPIFERTPVTRIVPRRAETAHGGVRARWVVRATEGYTSGLPGLRRSLIPMNSAMAVTAPLDEATWEQIGWEGCETLGDRAHVYCYLQRTPDGRIAIGGRGVPYRFGSRTDADGEVPDATVEELRTRLGRLFPAAAGAPIEHAWCGVLGVPRDWCASIEFDASTGLCSAGGYVGHGVATANLAGRTLRDLILGERTDLTSLPWVGHPRGSWEPEPLRWLAVRGIYAAYRRADRDEERSERPSRLAALADRVAGR